MTRKNWKGTAAQARLLPSVSLFSAPVIATKEKQVTEKDYGNVLACIGQLSCCCDKVPGFFKNRKWFVWAMIWEVSVHDRLALRPKHGRREQ